MVPPGSRRWRWWFPLGLAALAALHFSSRAILAKRLLTLPKSGVRISIGLGIGLLAFPTFAHAFYPDFHSAYFPTSISALLMLAGLAAFLGAVTWFAQHRRWWLCPALLAVVVLPFLFPQNQVENRLPHMRDSSADTDYYARPRKLVDIDAIRRTESGQLSDLDALQAWNRRMRAEFGEAQPVVLVTCSGGASASAIYTADVLLTLEEQCPGFSRRIRLVSGASGGMLGASYFVTQLRPGGVIDTARNHPAYRAYVDAAQDSDVPADSEEFRQIDAAYRTVMRECRTEFFRGLEADFLSPIVQKWLHKDLPLSPLGFLTGGTTNDRGSALERAWSTHLRGALDVPFGDLRPEEATGDLPSLVFTPMMVEDGRQLLISNLDLDYMVESGRLHGGMMSYTGLEFFKAFPHADEFRLSTAVRMNASFPFFSPAAALPTDPVRHVVDAGYYDNYGMVVATKWLNHEPNRRYLHGEFAAAKGAAGKIPQILLLRIKCFGNDQTAQLIPTAEELRTYAADRGVARVPTSKLGATADEWKAAGESESPVRTEGGMFTATAPLTGLFSSWRANMIYRSDERLNAAVARMERRDNGAFGVAVDARTILCGVEPSLNWVLTATEREAIHEDVRRYLADPLMFANFYRQRSTERRITAAGDPSQNAPLPPQSQRLEKPEIIAKQTELLYGTKNLTPTQLDSLKDKVKLGEFQSTLPLSASPKR